MTSYAGERLPEICPGVDEPVEAIGRSLHHHFHQPGDIVIIAALEGVRKVQLPPVITEIEFLPEMELAVKGAVTAP